MDQIAPGEESGGLVGHRPAGVGQVVARHPAVQHPVGVVDLAVPDQVDDGRHDVVSAAAVAAAGSAAATRSMAASSSAALTNHASNGLGGR